MVSECRKGGYSMIKKIIFAGIAVAVLLVVFVGARVCLLSPEEGIKRVSIPEGVHDPAEWGKHYPLEYQSYLKNREMAPSPTGFGGSEKVQKALKEPANLMNFKGMPFSKDYSEDRGHPYALDDLKESKRLSPKSMGACMTCKTAQMGDIFKEKGWLYAKTPLAEILPQLKHPITCSNCHDPKTMNLRVLNPAFIEAMAKKGVDVKNASRTEMRSYVCGQCHAEYYFEPETYHVVFPWEKGLQPEQMYAYYAGKPAGFAQDWIHPDSQAKMLKAQHPDFEIWSTGTHGMSGVACADCHMPYMREGGRKYSSHWVTSPMRTVEASCRTCHTQNEAWLLARVKTIQGQVWDMQFRAGNTVSQAHERIAKAAAVPNVNAGELEKARELVRKAQWYWDIVSAENSMGFHNPSQVLNTLGQSVDLAHQAMATAQQAMAAAVSK